MNRLQKFKAFNNVMTPQAVEALNVINSIIQEVGELKIEESEGCSSPPEYWCFDKVNEFRRNWNWVTIWNDGTITYPSLSNEVMSKKRSVIPITWEDRKWLKNLLKIDSNHLKVDKVYSSLKDQNSIIDYLDSLNIN